MFRTLSAPGIAIQAGSLYVFVVAAMSLSMRAQPALARDVPRDGWIQIQHLIEGIWAVAEGPQLQKGFLCTGIKKLNNS